MFTVPAFSTQIQVELQLRSRDGMLESARHHVEGLTAELRRAQDELGSSRGRSSESASELSMAQDMIRQIRKEGELVTRKVCCRVGLEGSTALCWDTSCLRSLLEEVGIQTNRYA